MNLKDQELSVSFNNGEIVFNPNPHRLYLIEYEYKGIIFYIDYSSFNKTHLIFSVAIEVLYNEVMDVYIIDGWYERMYPESFKDEVKYKNWLQSTYKFLGAKAFSKDLIDIEKYSMARAFYNACLFRNKGNLDERQTPTANQIFHCLKKLEVRYPIYPNRSNDGTYIICC